MLGHGKILEELKELKESGELGHGYIFFGPDGVGKKTAAMEFATWLEHHSPGDRHTLSDFQLFEPENGTFGIDTSRRVREFLVQAPNVSQKRTAVLDGADQMTDDAANALLKIAEEPPPASLIFLIVSDPSRMRDTLASRFQKIFFGAVRDMEIEDWLIKEKKIPTEKAKKAARISFGRPGLAMRILTDENFVKRQKKAVEFLNSRSHSRDFIKGLLEDELFLNKEESFQLAEFLDAVIFAMALEFQKGLPVPLEAGRARTASLLTGWHEVLKLRGTAENFGLNPRIQLLNLARFA